MKSLFVLGVFCAASASAQGISIGVIGGAPFTDVVHSANQNNLIVLPRDTNFTVGPSFQVNLPLNLRLEADALYRPWGFTAQGTGASGFFDQVSGSQWRFPVLAQYRFQLPIVKPFVEAGISFNHLANLSAAATNIASGTGHLLRATNAGVVLGGGVDLKIPFVRLSAELRYTRQGSDNFEDIRSNLNQAEVLVGIHF